MQLLIERKAKIKVGATVLHDRSTYRWVPENVDHRSKIDELFFVTSCSYTTDRKSLELIAPYYGFQGAVDGVRQYGSGGLSVQSADDLEFEPWIQLTEDQTLALMKEYYKSFHMPSFEIASGKLTQLTKDINASIDPVKEVMTSFMVGRDLRKVVCAAHLIKHESFEGGQLVIAGARHMQATVRNVMLALGIQLGGPNEIPKSCITQGFIDQYEEFMDREEAFKVAVIAGQKIDMSRNHFTNKLTSEGLY